MSDLDQSPKMTVKGYLIIASLLFGLFFGAGNLIFPVHLGQMAGHNWLPATIGFLSTSMVLPLLAILAISKTNSSGVAGIGRNFGPKFAVLFMIMVQLTIGPLYAAPRVATVSFAVGIEPLLPFQNSHLSLFIYSLIFFALAFYFAYQESTIIDTVGKIMNPMFLVLLAVVFILAFTMPMGDPAKQVADVSYSTNTYFKGFLEGYNTLDMIAGLVFGGTIINAVRELGFKKEKEVDRITSKAGIITMSVTGLIYIGLILMGTMSLGKVAPSSEGGTALVQIVAHYLGRPGQVILAAIMILACLTTAIGLLTSFAEDMYAAFPKVKYGVWLSITTVFSFLIANVGLDQLIKWSIPVLMFLYPIAIVLILLGLTVHGKKYAHPVYVWSVSLTFIPAGFDFIKNLPPSISQSGFGQQMAHIQNFLPFASIGLGWIVPSLLGVLLGVLYYKISSKKIA